METRFSKHLLVWRVGDEGYDPACEQLLDQLRSTTSAVGLVRSNSKRFRTHAVREFIDCEQVVEWLNIGPTGEGSIEDVRAHEVELDRVCDKFVPLTRKTLGLPADSPNHHMHQFVPQE